MTDTTITSDHDIDHDTDREATIDGYLACWDTTDTGERSELIERFWTTDARMVDPLVDVAGHAELAGVFG